MTEVVTLRGRRFELFGLSALSMMVTIVLVGAGLLVGHAFGGTFAAWIGGVAFLVVWLWRNLTVSVVAEPSKVQVRNRMWTTTVDSADVLEVRVRRLERSPNSPPIFVLVLGTKDHWGRRSVPMDATVTMNPVIRKEIAGKLEDLGYTVHASTAYMDWR